jgi:peptidoglycan/LPS O-acetylase OafA/YrhL
MRLAERTDKNAASGWAILSALRFFLAMVVVLGHCCFFVGGRHDWTYIGLWLNQGSAVFGFFILSGYSIAASLERSPAGFYRRRFIRIWPLYLGCIALGLLVSLRIPHGLAWPLGGHLPATSLASSVASLLMLQTILAPPLPIVGQIWSLSPEWWHYMVAPLLRKLSTFTLLTLLTASFLAFMTIAPPPGGGAEGFSHGLSLITLSWLWVTGFIYRRFDREPTGIAMLLIPSVLALFFGHFTGLPLFISIFTLLLSGEFKIPDLFCRICSFLGDVSFPLYLFHIPVMVLLISFGVRASAPIVFTALLASCAALYAIDYPSRAYFGAKKKHSKTEFSSYISVKAE